MRLLILFLLFSLSASGATYYVSPSGNDSNSGTLASPYKTIAKGVSVLSSGDILYIRDGIYSPSGVYGNGCYNAVYIANKNGTASNLIQILAYPGEWPVIDGTNVTQNGQKCGINLSGCSYLKIKGLTVQNVRERNSPTSPAEGFYGEGCSNITIEQCVSTKNGNGFRFDGNCNNIYYINCDAYDNWDQFGQVSSGGPGGYADGFRANIAAGMRQYFTGCRAWNNSDDGWDHMAGGGYTVMTNCWAFRNGQSISGTSGDGMGFKLGFTTRGTESGFQRSLYNCISAGNESIGFDESMDQATSMKMELYNCIAIDNDNDAGFRFAASIGSSSTTLRNNISYSNAPGRDYEGRSRNTQDHNSWNGGVTVSSADFVSIDLSQLSGPRNADGSLPDITTYNLVKTSDLIDKGVNIGNPFVGIAPDLGPFEYQDANPAHSTLGKLIKSNGKLIIK
jgi:hypothetical protein